MMPDFFILVPTLDQTEQCEYVAANHLAISEILG
jgi:hypothetical protein